MVEIASREIFRQPGECTVRVDDQEIADLYPYLCEVRVDMSRRAATVCTLVFDTIRIETGHWIVQDSGVFVPWKKIVVEAAFGSYNEEVMRGYIREVKLDCPQEMGSATVTVTGQDESILLDREHVRQTWSTEESPVTDGDVISRIAQDHGLNVEAESGLTNTYLSQDSASIRMVHDRAEANGFEVFVRQGILHFHLPTLEGEPQPAIMVYAGAATNCLRFSVNYDGHKPDQVSVTRAAATGTEVEEEVFFPDLPVLGQTEAKSDNMVPKPFVWRMEQPAGATLEEAKARAQAKTNENAWKIEAKGELDGAIYGHVMLTHETISVDGVGETNDGLYYVDEVKHTFNAEGYRQAFRLLRNATGEQG